MRLTGFNFQDAASGRACLADLVPQLTNGYEVLRFNALYKEIRAERQGDRGILQAAWSNLWLSRSGLVLLEAPDLGDLPEDFTQGMAARSAELGDIEASAPDQWLAPFTGGAEPHAVLVLAADDSGDLAARHQRLLDILTAHGATVIGTPQDGNDRPGDQSGREHFGFKDGISQPSIQNFTTSSKGGEAVPAGEFILGYPDADGHISGQPTGQPTSVATPYDPTPVTPPAKPVPPWAQHGSFVVYRRLRQDVASFRQSMSSKAGEAGLRPDQLAAKIVGRWPSGAPMEHVPGEPRDIDPNLEDPSTVYPAVLTDPKVNAFDYEDDPEGANVPRPAHIRKVNPRSNHLPDADRSQRHRMLRRGLTYGPEFQEGEAPYGGAVPDTQDRGLLFICYQASIARTFEFVQSRWANTPDFPQPGDGQDAIVSVGAEKPFLLPPDKHLTFASWVSTTGGAYFFSPSFSGLRLLIRPEISDESAPEGPIV